MGNDITANQAPGDEVSLSSRSLVKSYQLDNAPFDKAAWTSSQTKRQGSKSRLLNCNEKQKSKKRVRRIKSCFANCNKKSKPKRCVSFSGDVKTSDCLRQKYFLLERVVKDFLEPTPNVTILKDLVNEGNQQMLLALNDLLVETIKRVELSTDADGALLVLSGGTDCFRLKPCNLPRVRLLIARIHQSCDAIVMIKALTSSGFF